jgi:hypothetical protein
LYFNSTALAERGFGIATPPEILSRFQQKYGWPGYQEIKTALLRLNQPMDRMQPIEVILRGIEEVHMFLLASHDEGRQNPTTNKQDVETTIQPNRDTKTSKATNQAARQGHEATESLTPT